MGSTAFAEDAAAGMEELPIEEFAGCQGTSLPVADRNYPPFDQAAVLQALPTI